MEKKPFYEMSAVKALELHYEELKTKHLRELLSDPERNDKMVVEIDNMIFDYTHQIMDTRTLVLFEKLLAEAKVHEKIKNMFDGQVVNLSEGRPVMHMALRGSLDKKHYTVGGKDVMKDVHRVLGEVYTFSKKVREGKLLGVTGRQLRNFVAIGIGGSYLSIDFLYEALRHHPECKLASKGMTLRFIPNVDPIDFARVTEDLNAEETLFIVNSKTFTTAETILNAKTCRNWLIEKISPKMATLGEMKEKIVKSHMCAVSTAYDKTSEFGIPKENVFDFWDWVGGRYSVWSAIGALPLSLIFGEDVFKQILAGGEYIDDHFLNTKPLEKNIPMLLGVIGFYNTCIQKHESRAILPYSQCLHKFVPHIQQVSMESNGKDVSIEGIPLSQPTGPIVFGEPGTNGQHSFYQLIHQGRKMSCEFIGYVHSLAPIDLIGELVPNHDELMSNFFAQPDALARGITMAELVQADVKPAAVRPYKVFEGNRPSLSFLIDAITPFSIGQLLAIYEHRVAVEGFLFGINSWDQMGVELGISDDTIS